MFLDTHAHRRDNTETSGAVHAMAADKLERKIDGRLAEVVELDKAVAAFVAWLATAPEQVMLHEGARLVAAARDLEYRCQARVDEARYELRSAQQASAHLNDLMRASQAANDDEFPHQKQVEFPARMTMAYLIGSGIASLVMLILFLVLVSR